MTDTMVSQNIDLSSWNTLYNLIISLRSPLQQLINLRATFQMTQFGT
jgi:hypothetical protein